MGLKGKLIGSIEVKCGGHSIHDIIHINPHHLPNIAPNVLNHFEIHEGETIKVGSIVSWKFNHGGNEILSKDVVESVDLEKKSITWKVIGGNMLELYNSFTVITSSEHQWTTVTLLYEKKTEDTPEPLTHLGVLLNCLKDIESHLLKK
ncbi:kirola-like [Solanum tuberosum]|uniref:Sn-2 protein n=1 Tax=Solanum tuberosum TaxID=4113 RepID=M1ABV5_SOLTU|nr:PREDICTED: kirola-like [Solanum tuberosum]